MLNLVVVFVKLRYYRNTFTCEIFEILNFKFIYLSLYFNLTFVFRFI